MDGFLGLIYRYHNIQSTLAHDATLRGLGLSVPDVVNPLYEVEDALQDRIGLEGSIHHGIWCDGSQCSGLETPKECISGLRYCCVDCPPGKTDFCSNCVRITGQGVQHDHSHRLVQLSPTICALCENVMQLKVQEGDMFRGPYREFSASVAIFQRIAETESCGLCAFVWSALAQCPTIDTWPPENDENVTIRLRRPWRNCLQVAVVTASRYSKDTEICDAKYVSKTVKVADMEKELEVYISISKSSSKACLVLFPLQWY